MRHCGRRKNKGFSLVEALLAVSIFSLSITSLVTAIIYGRESSALAGSRARASYLANEGIEILRDMRDDNFSNLTDGSHGLAVSEGKWVFSGSSDTTEIFSRQIAISSVDSNTKQVAVTVSWPQNLQRNGLISLSTYLTNWRAPSRKGGMLVYGDGGTSTDEIKYKTIDQADGSWSGASGAADIDSGSNNRFLKAVRIYSSLSRDEKVMLSRHFDGTRQYIYAQVYDGDSWGDVTALSDWNANTFLDAQNFSGTYLENGNFLAVYSDNTVTPKMKIWNGNSWSSPSSLAGLGSGQIPVYITTKNRSGANEAMAVFFTQGSDTITQYYNGSSWSAIASHATAAPTNTKRMIDFDWSPQNPAKGVLVYVSGKNARNISAKIWTANGTGGGFWGAAASSANAASASGALAIAGRLGADEFQACSKNSSSVPSVSCYRISSAANRPVFSNPQNQVIAGATDSGIQRSFHIGFENSGNLAIGVYADNSSVLKLKKFDPSGPVWDSVAASIPVNGFSPGNFQTVSLVPYADGMDDIMIIAADSNQDVYSAVWNGANNEIYGAPSGGAFARHGESGSQNADFWFDFAWDKF